MRLPWRVRPVGFSLAAVVVLSGCASLPEPSSSLPQAAAKEPVVPARCVFGGEGYCSFRPVDGTTVEGAAGRLPPCVWGGGAGAGGGGDWGPLHWAVWSGSVEAAEVLLARGADPNARTAMGHTPLHWAAGSRDLEMARLLLRYGADPDAEDHLGHTPLSEATDPRARRQFRSYAATR